ncbi:hypothetical protein FO519_000433 [Halicephalobus sp. NKZ332]|nr:hypothetical protein FO519_000433 [Halicephalobus sp. NKZ332]
MSTELNPKNVEFSNQNAPESDTPLRQDEISALNKIINSEITHMNVSQTNVAERQTDPTSPLWSSETFESLKLKPELVKRCAALDFITPSKIQSACIPLLIRTPPVDVVAQAQNGTGKTATFLLAILHKIDVNFHAPQALIIAPTVELANQICEVGQNLAALLPNVTFFCATKGTNYTHAPISSHVVVGTPGSIDNSIIKFRNLDVKSLFCFVLDEADYIFGQPGFRDTVMRLLHYIRQTNFNTKLWFFSATFDDPYADQMIKTYAPDALRIATRRNEHILNRIKQYIVRCPTRDHKLKAIVRAFSAISVTSTIIFCYTRASVEWLRNEIQKTGRKVAILHGNMDIHDRADNVRRFAKSEYKVLIATSVAARGLDIPQVSLVINYDPPVRYNENQAPVVQDDTQLGYSDYDTYMHRVGRAGRFGKPGMALNLADGPMAYQLIREIEKYFGIKMEEIQDGEYENITA